MGDLGDVTTIDWHSFGSRLRRSRQRLGITQDELARRSGVSVRTLRHLELGQVAEPRADSLRRLTAVLGLTIPRSRTDDAAPGNALRISVLGPLQVASVRSPRRTEELRIGPAMPRNLLGLLALHPNRTVSREEIVDVLWPDDPPRTHVNLVHTYIARIRKAFKPGRPGKESIVASRGGYLLDVDENHLDLLRFDEFTSAARALPDTESRRKLDLYAAALACWRGPVLADVSASVRQQHAAVDVARRRVEAAIGYADLALRLGLHDRVAGELRGLVPAEPLHEGLHARLMLALAAAGDQVAALEVFAGIRARLVDELGIEPGRELQDTYVGILRHDLPAGQSDGARTAPPVVQLADERRNQLPRDVDDFTGRTAEIDTILEALPDEQDDAAAVVSVIEGMAGVGKTSLAVHIAWRLAGRYPDAQLFVDLHAHTSQQASLEPRVALGRLLRALGTDQAAIPDSVDERAALWRSMLADRRALVVLDDAASAEQVRPLLPGSKTCLVLVTSRHRLASVESTCTTPLDPLPTPDGVTLVNRIVGAGRTAAHRAHVEETVRLCGNLPLAITVAASRLRQRPEWPVEYLNSRLRDEQRRLAELEVGDRSVQGAFALSYGQLGAAHQRLFRLLGLHPGPDFGPHAAAAVGGIGLAAAEQIIEDLVDMHLLRSPAPGRYRFHELLLQYARDVAMTAESTAERAAAVRRLFDSYLRTADAAAGLIERDPERRQPVYDAEPPDRPCLTTESEALAWLDAERANLVAVISAAADRGHHKYASQLRRTLWRYVVRRRWHRALRCTPTGSCWTRVPVGDQPIQK